MDLFGLLKGFVVLVLVLVVLLLYRFRLRKIPGVPHPPMHWLAGHAFWMKENMDTLFDAELKVMNEVGPSMQICLPGKMPMLRTINPVVIKYILQDNWENFVKVMPGQVSFGHEFFGGGIFAVDGADAKQQRKTASHMFATRMLKDHMEKSFQSHSTKLVELLQRLQTQPGGTVVDMQDMLLRFTMDSFCKFAFGVNLNSLDSPQRPPFAWAFDRVQELLKMRTMYPDEVWKLQKRFQNEREREITKCSTVIRSFIIDIINERKDLDLDETKFCDLLSRFLDLAKKNNEVMDYEKLRDVVLNFVLAGRDSTGCLLTWALVEFSRHPEWEEKCLNEINGVLAGEAPSHDNVKSMTLLHMFLSECLRLHAPVPADSKRVLTDCILPDGTRVKTGTQITYLPYAAGRWSGNWGPDCLEFNPERWRELPLNPDEERKDFDFKFITFNAGPRICLGKGMAYMEAKMCLAKLLPKFKFALQPGADLSYKIAIILQLKHGLPMIVSPRQPATSTST